MKYDALFTPMKIGKMEVKNRIAMSPMGTNSAFVNGRKSDNEVDYFIERAKGGAGLIVMGCQPLNEKIAQGSMEGYMDSFTVLPALTSVCDGVHKYGAKIICQLPSGSCMSALSYIRSERSFSSVHMPSTKETIFPSFSSRKK